MREREGMRARTRLREAHVAVCCAMEASELVKHVLARSDALPVGAILTSYMLHTRAGAGRVKVCLLAGRCNRCWVCWFLSRVSAARRLCAARNSSSVLFFLFAAPLSCWRSCDASAPVAVSSRPPTRREHHYLAQLVCGVGLHRGRLCCRRGGGGRGVERDPCKLRNSPRLLRYHTCKNEKRLLVCSNGFC